MGGLRTKVGNVSQAINGCVYDVVMFVESWLQPEFLDSEFNIKNFNTFRRDRDPLNTGHERGGGIFIAVRNAFKANVIVLDDLGIEHLFVQVMAGNRRIIFGAAYIPPSSDAELYDRHCSQLLSLCEKYPNDELVMVGDYNVPDAVWSTIGDTLVVECRPNSPALILAEHYNYLNLFQVNKTPNRFGTFLDLVFVRDVSITVHEALDPLSNIVDRHIPYEFAFPIPFKNELVTYNSLYDFKSGDINSINEALASVDFDSLLDKWDVNIAVNDFYEILYKLIDTYIPIRYFKSSSFPIWFSGELKSLIREKKIAHAQYKKTNCPEDYRVFADLREQCKALQKVCYDKYIERVDAVMLRDPGQFWKHVNNMTHCSGYPKSMFLEDITKCSVDGIVNLFADNFSRTYSDADFRDPPPYSFARMVDLTNLRISLADVFDGIVNLKSSYSSGPDGVPSFLLKSCVCTLSKPLFHIFSLSLSSGVFPEYWKTSFITPIFKHGNRADIQNYRGVSVCSVIPKFLDLLVYKQLKYACRQLLIPEQHGFAQGRSTTTNLLLYENYLLSAFEDRLQVDSVYTDFSKAFDRVAHNLLLAKLKALGFGGGVISWIADFLVGRCQFVRIGNALSYEIGVTSGVPQGSHCGPLLFNLFVNDIGDTIVNSQFLMFADDLKIFRSVSCFEECELMQSDLVRLYVWCETNGLSLNVNKCFCISFSRKRGLMMKEYCLNNVALDRKHSARDLGVLLDLRLDFREHCNHVVNSALGMLGFITRNSVGLSINAFRLLYCCYVRSALEYAAVIWSPYRQVHIVNIESVQRKFLRTVACRFNIDTRNDPHNPHHIDYSPVLVRLNMQTLEYRRRRASILFLYRLLNGDIDCVGLLSLVNFSTTRRIRKNDLFYISAHTTDYANHNPLIQMCRLYNTLNLDPFKYKFNQFKRYMSTLDLDIM